MVFTIPRLKVKHFGGVQETAKVLLGSVFRALEHERARSREYSSVHTACLEVPSCAFVGAQTTTIRILHTMVSGIPCVLDLRTRI